MMNTDKHESFMRKAINLSLTSIEKGGGPFGAVVVKDGEIISATHNQVTQKNDPTAHAEVEAIRQAAENLNNFDLSGCEIYTSCEPCPMCLGAIYWARIDKVYYANTKSDARAIGFDDSFIYEEMARPLAERHIPMVQLLRDEAQSGFRLWDEKGDKTEY